jgi:hypothetical protein
MLAIGVVGAVWLIRWALTPFLGEWFQLGALLVLIAFFLMGFGLLAVAWSDLWSSDPTYVVTRTMVQQSAVTDRTNLKQWDLGLRYVTEIRLEQGFWGRLFGYGDLLYCTEVKPEGALRFAGILAPIAFKARVEKLRDALRPGSIETAGAVVKFDQTSPPQPDKPMSVLSRLGCAFLVALVAYTVGYIAWYAWSVGHQSMKPGESRKIHVQSMGLMLRSQVAENFDWTDADTAAVETEIASRPGIEIKVTSISISVSKMGATKLIAIEYDLSFHVLPDTMEGIYDIVIRFRHPRLGLKNVVNEPVQRTQIKVQK